MKLDIKKTIAKILSFGIFKDSNDDVELPGNLNAIGYITIEDHANPIGWYNVKDGSLDKVTGTSFTPITASAITLTAGRWIVLANARYNGATTGNRGVSIYKSNTLIEETQVVVPAIPSTSWATSLTTSAYISTSSDITVNIGLLQNSGSALTTNWKLTYFRIR